MQNKHQTMSNHIGKAQLNLQKEKTEKNITVAVLDTAFPAVVTVEYDILFIYHPLHIHHGLLYCSLSRKQETWPLFPILL